MTIFCRDCGRELQHRNRRGGFDPATGAQEMWQELRCPSFRGWLGWHEDLWVWEHGSWIDQTLGSLHYGQPLSEGREPDAKGAG